MERRARITAFFPAAWVLLLLGCTGYIGPETSPADPAGGGSCGDVLSSPANCGRCGNACGSDQICDAGACKPRTAGCSGGRLLCGSSCVDGQSDPGHCGACDRVCGQNRTCSAGACTCSGGTVSCGDACADLQSDPNHCGQCNTACGAGRSCQAGACVCPSDRTICGDACADTQSDPAHCGSCDAACTGGQVCTGGSCMCPSGQQLCGASCVDTLANDLHCGSCEQRCELGQTCSQGLCGGGGPGEDGCSTLAQNLTLEQIAVYQSVKVTIMDDNAAIAPASRNTDVVADRDALFRVFVTLGAGWSARELSARLFIENGDTVDRYFERRSISTSSTDPDTMNSFQIQVPRQKITPETRYAVEVVECGAGSGGVLSPRFPATDGAELGARVTGVLKVQIIPVQANGGLPDTSAGALQIYRDQLQAMYPVTDVELTVGDTITTGFPINWSPLLDTVRAKRLDDGAPDDVYYYGLLKPTDTLQQFCGGGCTAGIGFVAEGGFMQASARAAVGIGFGDGASAETMAHEIGHNHGRYHAPCVEGGTISDVDPDYPYDGAELGVWGYDSRDDTLLDPDDGTDIMSYCDDQWVSDYTYDALLERVAEVNSALSVLVPPELLKTFHVLLLDAGGARWGRPITRPSLPAGRPEPAEILDAAGGLLRSVEVYRTAISEIDAYSIQIPTPEPGWHSVRVRGAAAVAFSP